MQNHESAEMFYPMAGVPDTDEMEVLKYPDHLQFSEGQRGTVYYSFVLITGTSVHELTTGSIGTIIISLWLASPFKTPRFLSFCSKSWVFRISYLNDTLLRF